MSWFRPKKPVSGTKVPDTWLNTIQKEQLSLVKATNFNNNLALHLYEGAFQAAVQTGVTPDIKALFTQFTGDHQLQEKEWFVLLWQAGDLVAKRDAQ